MHSSKFKNKFPTALLRLNECNRLRFKYPNRIPIVLVNQNNTKLPRININRYLAPYDMTVGQLLYIIRKRINIPPEMGIFLYTGPNRNMLATSYVLRQCYFDNMNVDDHFLYIYIAVENTFGV